MRKEEKDDQFDGSEKEAVDRRADGCPVREHLCGRAADRSECGGRGCCRPRHGDGRCDGDRRKELYDLGGRLYDACGAVHLRADDKSLSYGAELNGIFTGSTGIKAYFPGEGFWGAAAQTTITVTSVADIGEKFRVHIGGEWQRYGYVTYDWNGETLYRTINSCADNSTYYYREDNVKDVGSAQYLPVQGHLNDTDLGRREAYIGFEMQTDGTFNVVLVSGHNAGVHKTIASF